MRTVCLVKFVPDVDNFKYDFERNVLIRENTDLVMNPDDAKALAFALKMKKNNPEMTVEILSMGPKNVIPKLEECLRLKVDHATLISDSMYVGSDTYVTSKILATVLNTMEYDCILTGTHSLDGDTAHVPSQIAEVLGLDQLSNVIDISDLNNHPIKVCVESENFIENYEVSLPLILSVNREAKVKLPYVRYDDLHIDVSHQLTILDNNSLKFDQSEVGLEGSLTKVARSFIKTYEKKDKIVVQCNEEGVDQVYRLLKRLGHIQ